MSTIALANDAKPTPSPWILDPAGEIQTKDGTPIAYVYEITKLRKAESAMNAALLHAAPELKLALSELLAAIESEPAFLKDAMPELRVTRKRAIMNAHSVLIKATSPAGPGGKY